MNSVAHIINPFVADPSSDLYTAQPLTFESMRQAKQKAQGLLEVELLSAHFEEDTSAVPSGFKRTRPLDRSVLSCYAFQKPVRLPLIADILQRLYEESDAAYLIYTNVDIGLYPGFYIRVNELIDAGHDAFIINRRRLEAGYTELSQLPDIYRDQGRRHPGFDCFVFHRSLFPKLKLEGICIGVPFIEIAFSQNLFALSERFILIENERLTFHIGMEIFKKRAPKEYLRYNQGRFWNLVPHLSADIDLRKWPYARHLWPVRMIRWGLHPCIPIRLVLKQEWRRLKQKLWLA